MMMAVSALKFSIRLNLRLNGYVERSRRLVRDRPIGLQARAIAIITRWRIPPDI